MQQPLAHTFTLHRVRPRNSTNVCATLQPLVFFTEEGKNGHVTHDIYSTGAVLKESLVERHAPLRVLLECFAGKLLSSHSRSPAAPAPSAALGAGEDRSSTFLDAYSTHGSAVGASSISAEGLFIQVPSRRFVSACARSAISPTSAAMDIVRLNQSDSNASDTDTDNSDGDDGYIYGFVQYMAFGCAGGAAEGMLLGAFSRTPLFTLLRAIVLETIPRVARTAAELQKTCSNTAGKDISNLAPAALQIITKVYAEVLAPLGELVSSRGSLSATVPGRPFTLRFARSPVTFIRPDDARYPLIALPVTTLLMSFSYDAIRVVQSLLLQERRVIFIGATAQHAAACVVSVPALLVPFVWSYPLVPFLPSSACHVLDPLATGSGSFVLGVTPDMVPQLMLHTGFTGGSEDKRLWFADGRTGTVGAGPRDLDLSAFVSVNIMPPSEKLKDAMKRIVSKEQRRLFRVALSHSDTASSSLGAFSSFPTAAVQSMEDLHMAFMEYNVSRLVGNYRKGLLPMTKNNSFGSSGNARNSSKHTKSPSGVAFALDYTRFLPANLDNNLVLAQRIAETRMLHHWSTVVPLMETLGLGRCLLGEFICGSRTHSSPSSSIEPKSHGEKFVSHYYFSNARMISLLCLFFTRAVRRFPELYTELQGSTVLRAYESGSSLGEQGGTSADGYYGSGASTDNPSGGDGRRLMRTLFSRATKAVKNSLGTQHQQVPLHVFIQAYGSFVGDLGGEEDINTPARLNKHYWDNHASAVTLAIVQPNLTNTATGPVMPPPRVSVDPNLYSFSRSSSTAFEPSMSPAGRVEESTTTTTTTTTTTNGDGTMCRRLPIDLVHQFEHYHALLNPTRGTAYTTGLCVGEEALSNMSLEQLEIFVEFGQLLAGEPAIWPAMEQARQLLLCCTKEQEEEMAYKSFFQENKQPQRQKEQEQEPQAPQLYLQDQQIHPRHQEEYCQSIGLQQSGIMGTASNAPVGFSCVPFEAQPLLFSSELVTRDPILPPEWQPKQWEVVGPATALGAQHGMEAKSNATPAAITTLQQRGNVPPAMTSSIPEDSAERSRTATVTGNRSSSGAATVSSQVYPSGTVMDKLFAPAEPLCAPSAVLQPCHPKPKQLEDFFR